MEVDVFWGPNPESRRVFIVTLLNKEGVLDEEKYLLGWLTEKGAKRAMTSQYWESSIESIAETSVSSLKEWYEQQTATPEPPGKDPELVVSEYREPSLVVDY